MAAQKKTVLKIAAEKIDGALLRDLVARADAAMAREKLSDSDTPTDKLFTLLMARIDVMQADRARYVRILQHLRQHPPLLHTLAPQLFASMNQALEQAGLAAGGPRQGLQAAGLLAAYTWALRAWEKDTQADLPATMRALDQGLRRGAQAAAWIGLT